MDNTEEVPRIVVEELKGRNITIVKTKAENNPPKTLIISKASDEENTDVINNKNGVENSNECTSVIEDKVIKASEPKVKPKTKRITKKVIEARLIDAYVKDAEMMIQDLENSGIDMNCHKCKRCEFRTHS